MRIRIAHVEEPPFYWTSDDGRATGADIELAEVVLHAAGAMSIEPVPTTFEQLLPGVRDGRWDMNVPIFVTAERARQVAFSVPVWAMVDGLLVHRGNPKGLDGYGAVARRADARLGVIPGQVQFAAARVAGVADAQLVEFAGQPEALAALRAGRIDAFSGTALGARAIAQASHELEVVVLAGDGTPPLGAFSFSPGNVALREAVDRELRRYLGTPDHRERMARYGFSAAEIDGALATSA
jgi:polar amino acid transport system substrate-binding protein